MSPHEALQHYFGFSAFRPGQEVALNHVLAGRDTLVVMPTGAGKSLIYQLAALLLPHITLVISPLVALMKDQIDSLTRRGIPATCLHSGLDLLEHTQRLQELSAGHYKIVLVAPERLRNPAFRQAMAPLTVGLLAVDEAHCLSQWGHDFRPDYLHIAEVRHELRIPQTLALTATATPRVQDDIITLLELSNAACLVTGFNRPNLTFDVQAVNNVSAKRATLQTVLRHVDGACLIYAGTRRDTEDVAAFIESKLRLPTQYYHGGLDPEQRTATQDAFVSGKLSFLVATNAFGMGIDRPDVRLVLHYSLPGTLEAYYQEAGRAGRDRQSARALLLYAKQDVGLQEFFIENDAPSLEELRAVYRLLERNPGMRADVVGVATNISQVKARVALAQLETIGALRRRPGSQSVEPQGLEEESLRMLAAEVAARRQYKHAQLRLMVGYATGKTCRRRVLLDHFGDPDTTEVAHCCDRCAVQKRKVPAPPPAPVATPPAAPGTRELLETVAHYALALRQSKLMQFLQGVALHEIISDHTPPPANLAELRLSAVESMLDTLLQAGYLQHVDGPQPVLQLTPQALTPTPVPAPRPAPAAMPAPARQRPTRPARGTAALSGQLLLAGRTPEQVAAERSITLGTVYAHLAELIQEGHLDSNAVVPTEVQAPIRAAISQIGNVGYMAPIKALLPDTVSYDVLRCVVAAWKWERRHPPVSLPTPAPPKVVDLPIVPLRLWRQEQAATLGQQVWQLFSEETLQYLARHRPQTMEALHNTPGLYTGVVQLYGEAILAAITSASSTEMVDAILACIRSLPGALPRSGVAQLLVGSQARETEKLQGHPLYNRLATYTRRDVLLQIDVLLEIGVLQSDAHEHLVLAATVS